MEESMVQGPERHPMLYWITRMTESRLDLRFHGARILYYCIEKIVLQIAETGEAGSIPP
jgi:hypothetical protein